MEHSQQGAEAGRWGAEPVEPQSTPRRRSRLRTAAAIALILANSIIIAYVLGAFDGIEPIRWAGTDSLLDRQRGGDRSAHEELMRRWDSGTLNPEQTRRLLAHSFKTHIFMRDRVPAGVGLLFNASVDFGGCGGRLQPAGIRIRGWKLEIDGAGVEAHEFSDRQPLAMSEGWNLNCPGLEPGRHEIRLTCTIEARVAGGHLMEIMDSRSVLAEARPSAEFVRVVDDSRTRSQIDDATIVVGDALPSTPGAPMKRCLRILFGRPLAPIVARVFLRPADEGQFEPAGTLMQTITSDGAATIMNYHIVYIPDEPRYRGARAVDVRIQGDADLAAGLEGVETVFGGRINRYAVELPLDMDR